MITRLMESLIGALKREPEYRFTSRYSTRQWASIVYWRVLQLLRGFRMRLALGRSSSPVFCGRGVRVEHGYMVRSGPSLILEDGVYINGLSRQGITLGRNVTIARGAVITCTGVIARCGEGLTIGDRSAVGALSFLGGQGGIHIGDDVIMGPGVRIFSENHIYSDPNTTIRTQGEKRAPVTIEDDCWIGAGATLLAGVIVGRGSVVAAGAVVTKSVPAFSVVGGVPAKVIARRGSDTNDTN